PERRKEARAGALVRPRHLDRRGRGSGGTAATRPGAPRVWRTPPRVNSSAVRRTTAFPFLSPAGLDRGAMRMSAVRIALTQPKAVTASYAPRIHRTQPA